MIENYRTGLLWKLYERSEVKPGLVKWAFTQNTILRND
jgi:hypothetical protein